MSVSSHAFVAWEEHIISQEKGNRIVHFHLKDASGNSVLAVVGTERSIRHMIYVVSDEFLQAHGSKGSINACTKWRARREVVDWLRSLVLKNHPSLDTPGAPINDPMQALGSNELLATGLTALQSHLPNQMIQTPRKCKVQNSDIVWSGVTWICCKQLKHYPAFCRNGTTISIHSFVVIMAEEETQYLGYLEDLYEDKKGQKKVKVRWFHHNQEVKGVVPQLNPHPREVFITPHVQAISAECIDGPATVLTPKHYERCLAVGQQTLSSGVYMCHRQFKNNKEWVPAFRVAAPDKVGMRCSGRLAMRPWPPEDSPVCSFEVGMAVDAWWSDGWWEGFVTGINISEGDSLQVYFPGEDRLLTLKRKNLRTSRDWVDNRWIDIKAKPDILSYINSIVSPSKQHQLCSSLAEASECGGSASMDLKVHTTSKLKAGDEDKRKLPGSTTTCAVLQNGEGVSLRKISHLSDECEAGRTYGNYGDDGTCEMVRLALEDSFAPSN